MSSGSDNANSCIMAESASTVIASAAATVAITLIARQPLGENFIQQFLVYGGTVALAENVTSMIYPRLMAFIQKEASQKSAGSLEQLAVRGGAVFGISYLMFMLAGTPSIAMAGGAAIGSIVGQVAYDSIIAGKLKA